MDTESSEFKEVEKEIEELSILGFFGDRVKELVESIDDISLEDYFIKILEDWIQDTHQYGKENVKTLGLLFIKLYNDAIQIGGQQAVDVLTAFIKGFPDHPETESLSSYAEFVRSNVETKKLIAEIQLIPNITIREKKKLADSIIGTYIKGVEFVNKMLTTCIILLKIIENEKIKPMESYSLFLGEKSKEFIRLSRGKYDIILDMIDRDIRNAGSHLNIRYSTTTSCIHYKTKRGKSFKTQKISFEDFMLKKFPTVGWITQAYVYSQMLLVLAGIDPDKCKIITKKIFES